MFVHGRESNNILVSMRNNPVGAMNQDLGIVVLV